MLSPSKAISASFASRQSFYDPFQDVLDAILPFDRRDHLAALLTDDDVATLNLAQEGMGENTLRALASDLGYLEAWCQLATGSPLPWPASESLLLKFVAHHLWDPVKRAEDPAHGLPADVEVGLHGKRPGGRHPCKPANSIMSFIGEKT